MNADCHVHLALNGSHVKKHFELLDRRDKESETLIRNILKLYKNNNIHKLRDGGDAIGIGNFAKSVSVEENIIYKTPLKAFYKSGCYGSLLGMPINNMRDFRMKFLELLKLSPDFIKIIYTGIVKLDEHDNSVEIEFTDSELSYMIKTSHEAGLKVMIHVNSAKAILKAITLGADTIEHGYFINSEVLCAMKENQTAWIPTITPIYNTLNRFDDFRLNENIKRIIANHKVSIYEASKTGINLALGSDSGSRGTAHGKGYVDEMNYFIESGITLDDMKKIIDNGNNIIDGL